ncbi:Alpha/Beta hydrolase protein [Panaeolus papilionaceus]|nr:Alpha/Beta hydrolase protein [Panaeolus papilionaceus]
MGFFRKLLQHRAKLFVYPGAFYPDDDDDESGFDECDDSTNLELTTPDKITLRCTIYSHDTTHALCSTNEAKGTVILFHGNAMTHIGMYDYVSKFYRMGFDVLAAEYRGFGTSTGCPSEKGLRIDAQTILDHVLSDPRRSQRPIIIFGQSLGGAVAIDLTSRNNDRIAALIVENTFTSIPDIMKDWGFIGHFSFLCSEKWRSASRMARISHRIPVLLLSATEDTIIQPLQMTKLRDIANERGLKASKKNVSPTTSEDERGQVRLELLENCGHNTSLNHPKYWKYVQDFVKDSLKHWGMLQESAESFTDSK